MGREFIGRTAELNALKSAYLEDTFQMCIVYGRRRIGKTTLVNEFIKEKEHISYTAIKGSLDRNLELFGQCVIDYFMPGINGIKLNSLSDILNIISMNVSDKKLIIFIDELPYLSECDSSFLSLLQREIDLKWINSKIFLILSGSAISFMEQEVLSAKSPLYGRRTMQINLKPFNYLETAEFVPNYSCEEKAICYGLTGGVAKYISMFKPEKSLDDNIIDLYFSSTGYMFEEPYNLLTQEFKNATVYDNIISAIANGANKAVEIKDKTKLESASIYNVIDNLIETRIVKKTYAITEEKNNKKVQYVLADGMFRFWHQFVPKAIPTIEMNNGRDYYFSQVKPKLHEYMGEIFEDICRQFMLMHGYSSNLPCKILEVGKWNGTNPRKKEQTDIDVVGLDTQNNKAILGECKFRNSPMDKNMLEELINRNGLIDNKYTTVGYFLFSLGGFSKWLEENKDNMVYLISIDEMYRTYVR